jgi:hypothetical protein
MGAAGLQARHAEGIVVSVRSIRSRLAALVDAAVARGWRGRDGEDHDSSCGVVEVAGTSGSTSASRTAAALQGRAAAGTPPC